MNSIRRRDLLAAFLGGPAAMACIGCSQGKASSPIPKGELAGSSVEFGHVLRDFARNGSQNRPPSVSENFPRQPKVIIVGTGIAGLAAARRLEAGGERDFLLLELEDKAGGKSTSGKSAATAYPWAAHYVPSPRKENRPLVDLFEEMGAFEGRDQNDEPIPQEHWIVRDPESRIFYKGIWYEGLYLRAGASLADLSQRKQFEQAIDQWVAWRDGNGRRAFAIPSSTCSDDAEVMALDKLTMAEWMKQNGFTSPRLTWYVDYACRDDYGLTIDHTSAWAGIFYFAARRHDPGGPSQPFITWPEGNGFVVKHLQRPLHDRIHTGWAAARIGREQKTANTADGALEVNAVSREGRSRLYRTERVIFAAPRFLAPYVVEGMSSELKEGARQFDYGAWAVSNVHLKSRPREGSGFPMCWDNVLYESRSLGYIVATHQRGPEHGATVLTHYYPFCGADGKQERERLLETSREDWAEIVLSDLEVAHPEIRQHCSQLDVARWGHAMIRPKPGFIDSKARRRAAEPFNGIHFAHSDLSGLSLFEEAFDHGWRAGGEVIESLTQETT